MHLTLEPLTPNEQRELLISRNINDPDAFIHEATRRGLKTSLIIPGHEKVTKPHLTMVTKVS